MRRRLIAILLLGATTAPAAWAQPALAYPARPIQFVVGFPAGSSIDVISRIVLDDVRSRSGATIVIENKPGALGALGLDAVAKAPADGYTMMPSSSATHSSGPHLMRALQKVDVQRGATHIGRVASFDIAVVTAASDARSAAALVAKARSAPDGLTYGFGSGTGRVAAAVFSRAAGIPARDVPYRGQPAALTDLVGGQIDFVAADLGAVLPLIRGQKIVPVAVLADRRSNLLPEVPTALEAGVKGASLRGWIGVSGPAGLSVEVQRWWSEQLRASLASADVQARIRSQGMEPDLLLDAPMRGFVQAEHERWGRHVAEAGIPLE